MSKLVYGRAVCYSGYRHGQSPISRVYPSYEEIKEDLMILKDKFDYIRMYDPSNHAKTVLQVIRDNNIPLKVMLGADLVGEVNNPNCPWDKRVRSEEELSLNKKANENQIDELIKLANEYGDIIIAVSCGNESVSSWNPRMVKVESLLEYATKLKKETKQLVTFCEGPDGWVYHLDKLVEIVDIISVHSYPLWARIGLDGALKCNKDDYYRVKNKYPNKQVIFTELGWASKANFKMNVLDANEENQNVYLKQVLDWCDEEKIIAFIFEAFDEPWKGSNEEDEPEKHWGIYKVDRKPKLFMSQYTYKKL